MIDIQILHKATQLWFWGWQSFHLLKSFEEFINSQRTLMAQTWHLTHPGTKCSHATCNRPKTTSVSGALMKSISRSFATVASWWQDPLATCLGESSWYHQHHHQQHHHVGAKAGTRTLVHQNKIKNRAKYLEKRFFLEIIKRFSNTERVRTWDLGNWDVDTQPELPFRMNFRCGRHSKRTIRNEHVEVDHESCSSSTNLYPQCVFLLERLPLQIALQLEVVFFTWKITMPKQISYVCIHLYIISS